MQIERFTIWVTWLKQDSSWHGGFRDYQARWITCAKSEVMQQCQNATEHFSASDCADFVITINWRIKNGIKVNNENIKPESAVSA